MPLRNRVDPWGDLHAVEARGLFSGNRGCLVDDDGRLTRHHKGPLWITCRTEFRDWKHPLAAPRTWTPLFFLDDGVALAAGHRPCGLCRRTDYLAFCDAVGLSTDSIEPILAMKLNRRLGMERHRRGRGLARGCDRILWTAELDALPSGSVVLGPSNGEPQLVTDRHLQTFAFDGWGPPSQRPEVSVSRS